MSCDHRILKKGLFHRDKELLKSSQTWYGVFHGYIDCKTKRVSAIACLGKKLRFRTEICAFRKQRILKVGLLHRIKELFKSNQTRYGVSHGYLYCKTKRIFAIACLGKKLVFHTKVCEFRD